MRSPQFRTIAAPAVLCCSAAFAQVGDGPVVNLVDGPVSVVPTFDLPIGTGPAQNRSGPFALAAGLAFYTANYSAIFPSFGAFPLPFNIVGTDPSLGANTTTIPTVIAPLKFIFPNAGNPALDGANVVAPPQNCPIFLSADYTP